jgi:FSR family fosmidomycin resistance protein-like MFS transporter
MEAVAGFPKREVQAISLISFAHMLSHLYWLALPLIAPLMMVGFGISALQWGLALGVFAVTTGVFQTPMGLVVERIGGRRVLIGGLLLISVALFAIGYLATSYWMLVTLMAIAGIGNSVFHPADYSLLDASVEESRIGRAFSVHSFSGQIGFVVAAPVAALFLSFLDWRGAMMALGLLGIVTTILLIIFGSRITEGTKVKKKTPIGDSLRELLTSRPVMLFFAFYMFSSLGNFGVTQFAVLAFQPMYGLDAVAVVAALTAYQVGALILILPGGMLADKTERYDIIMLAGFGVAAAATYLVGTGVMPFWMVIGTLCLAGAMRGGVNATRDVAVRQVIKHLPIGTVFAFVSTGFTVGQAIGGVVYGYIFDNFPPAYVFYASALFTMLGALTVLLHTGARKARTT